MKDAIQHMFRTKAEKVLQDQAEGRTEELTGTFKPSPWNENEKKKKKRKRRRDKKEEDAGDRQKEIKTMHTWVRWGWKRKYWILTKHLKI